MYFTKKLLFLFIFFGCFAIYAQERKGKEVLNIFTFEEVEELHQQTPKPILIFLYTDWCKICFGMKKTTFKDQEVIKLLNNNFYFIKLNAEEKQDITFLGRTFMHKPSGNSGTHELAKELAYINGKNSYPTTTILNINLEIDLQVSDYISRKKMSVILSKLMFQIPDMASPLTKKRIQIKSIHNTSNCLNVRGH
jgi:thioredoxin-related protein